MKPSFALNITDTAIGLLHRTARGWLQVGETAFDTADLAEALGYLRGSALGLSPGGLTTKLVLPNSQIKYLELDAPGPTDADRRNQLRAALVGRTPYNVEDLVFDWSGTGPKLQVAVIARETLDEAEAFAVEHRFNPVSFVGLPPKGDFKGEPWFGQTKASASVLEKGEKVDRDAEPVHVTGRDLPKSHPGAAKAAASSSGDVEEAAANPLTENEKPTRAQRRAAATAAAEQSRVSQVEQPAADKPMASDVVTEPTAELTAQTDVPSVVAQSAATNTAPEIQATAPETAPWWASPDPVAEPAASASGPSAAAPPETSVINNQAFSDPVPDNASVATTATPDDLPPAPSAAMMAAFASRRAGEAPSTNRYGGAVADPMSPRASLGGSDLADRLSGKSTPPPLSRPKVGGDASSDVSTLRSQIAGDGASASIEQAMGKMATGKPSTAFVTAPSIPGSRKRKSLPPGAAAAVVAPDARKSLTKPGGTFASSEKRGKPRYLGLILTGLLLLFLALIAAWSSFFLASNEAAQNGTAVVSAPEAAVPATEIAAAVPAIDDEMLADSQDPADFAGQDASAADAVIDPATDLAAQAPVVGAEPAVETAVEATPVPEPAPVGIASTDSPSAAPLNEAQDEIFLAAIDAPPLVLDPLSLPQPAASTDALPLPQLEPPPFGTVYQFDADGRIRPTPEGIITPEGVRLVAGKPSLVPPTRPDALIAVALPSNAGQGIVLPEAAANGTVAPVIAPLAQTAVPFPSDPALADARPRPRPEGLAPPAAQQANDGASLSEPSATRTSSLRPLPRPTAILAAGEAARQSTAAASLTAQAQQAAAVEAAVQASFQPDPNSSPLAVAVSRKPAPRPKDMSRAVEAAVAAAVRAPEPQIDEAHPEADAEPEIASAAPAIPTRASVAKQATYVNAINLSKINLIGVYGSKSSPYALVRQANGRYKKVKVGDSIDGGKVAAILASELRYQKSGRMISLKLPKT